MKYFKVNRKGNYTKTCDDCRAYATKVRGEMRERNKGRFKCEKCDSKFNTNGNLKDHVKSVHNKIKDFECDLCNHKCSSNSNLKRHIKHVHDKIKDFECDLCNHKCSSYGNLQLHIKMVHLKIKDFECDKCDSKFSINSNLKRHIKMVHLKIKDFECTACNHKYSSYGILQLHIKMVHLKIKDFECDLCNHKCSSNYNLQLHIKRIHDEIKDFECEKCDYKSSTSGDLQMHIKTVHLKIKDFECEKCDYKCSTNGNLQAHIKTCTGETRCSSGEFEIMQVLNKLKIKYEYNTSYKVKHKSYLRWDFIVKINKKRAFIEFDGQQHFEPVKFGGMSEEQAQVNFNKGVVCDNLKNQFCKDKGLRLLRIAYFDKDNIEEIVKEFFNIENKTIKIKIKK